MVICKSMFNSIQLTLPECVTSTGYRDFLLGFKADKGVLVGLGPGQAIIACIKVLKTKAHQSSSSLQSKVTSHANAF